jgi:hypothetical protein
MDHSDVVFLGRVVAARYEITKETGVTHSVLTVAVEQLWKGTTSKQIQFFQPLIAGGINFQEAIGVEYVIYAKALTPELRVRYNLSPTGPSGYIADNCWSEPSRLVDLKALGPSRPPE